MAVTETAQLLGISRGTVSKIMTAYEKEGKTRDRRTLNRILWKNH